MTTSNVTTFNMTTKEIVEGALRQCGALGEGELANDAQYTEVGIVANMLLKQWAAAGLELSSVREVVMFPEVGETRHVLSSYDSYKISTLNSIGQATSSSRIKDAYALCHAPVVHAIAREEQESIEGQTITAASLSLLFDTDEYQASPLYPVLIGDTIGLYRATAGTMEWGVVSNITSYGSGGAAATHISVKPSNAINGITMQAAEVGDTVYYLRSDKTPLSVGQPSYEVSGKYRAPRPAKILEAYSVPYGQNNTFSLEQVSRSDFDSLSNLTATGIPNQFYYDEQREAGILHVWPQTNDPRNYIRMRISVPTEDLLNSTTEVDLPQHWMLALTLHTALIIAPTFGVPTEDFRKIQYLADMYFTMASDFDQESGTSMYIQIDNQRR